LQTLAREVSWGKYRPPAVVLFTLVLSMAGLVAIPTSAAAARANDAVASVAPVTSAMTATSKGACPASYVCFWVDAYYSGPMGKFQGNNANWGSYTQSSCQTGTWENCASSTFNNGNSCAVNLYMGRSYDGSYLWEQRGSFRDNLAYDLDQNGKSFNDTISSNYWMCD
jgi:hypothetical protein